MNTIVYWVATIVPRVYAQGIEIENPLGCPDWVGCIKSFLGGVAILAIPVVGIMILVGGFQIMASGGDEEKLKKGKNTILYAALGYAVIILASGVATIINSIVQGATSGN